jgi:hypothetical protein
MQQSLWFLNVCVFECPCDTYALSSGTSSAALAFVSYHHAWLRLHGYGYGYWAGLLFVVLGLPKRGVNKLAASQLRQAGPIPVMVMVTVTVTVAVCSLHEERE